LSIALVRLHPVLIGLAVAAALGACTSRPLDDKCDKPQEYQSAQNLPDVVVPPGLVALDKSRSLVIPPETPGPEGPVMDNCLDRPPPYFRRDPNAPAGNGALGSQPPPPSAPGAPPAVP
jgi:hypothetical protein